MSGPLLPHQHPSWPQYLHEHFVGGALGVSTSVKVFFGIGHLPMENIQFTENSFTVFYVTVCSHLPPALYVQAPARGSLSAGRTQPAIFQPVAGRGKVVNRQHASLEQVLSAYAAYVVASLAWQAESVDGQPDYNYDEHSSVYHVGLQAPAYVGFALAPTLSYCRHNTLVCKGTPTNKEPRTANVEPGAAICSVCSTMLPRLCAH